MTYEVKEELASILKDASEKLIEFEIHHKEDEFTIVQPYNDGNAIILRCFEDEDGRMLKVEVSDTVVVLPQKDGLLDVFEY